MAGEVLDVHAFTGGYNLQAAFSTGHLAALSAVRSLEMRKLSIAIDGPAGAGKSSVSKFWQQGSGMPILIPAPCTGLSHTKSSAKGF